MQSFVLLAVSLGFYSIVGSPMLAVALLLTAGVAHLAARNLRAARGAAAGLWWVLGIGWVLLVLVVLKYAPAVLSGEGGQGGITAVLLPVSTVGVSYWALQSISYLTDVRRGHAEPERNPIALTLSLAFFPKVLQGPIERCNHLIPQLKRPISFSYENARRGLVLVALGLLKKLVVANRLAPFVDTAFAAPEAHQGLPLLVALYLYSFQIYFDFSGYTDIALGVARVLGVKLTDNFDRPYWSTSVAMFWRRWHVTLSNWLRDYLFLPLSYSLGRRLEARMSDRVNDRFCYAVAAIATMSICGLWHGPRATFLAWGALHGAYLALSNLSRGFRSRAWRLCPQGWRQLRDPLAVVLTFHLVALSWLLFRSESLGDAWRAIGWIGSGLGTAGFWGEQPSLVGVVLLTVWLALESRFTREELMDRLLRSPLLVRWAVYYAIVLVVFYQLRAPGPAEFIYFRF